MARLRLLTFDRPSAVERLSSITKPPPDSEFISVPDWWLHHEKEALELLDDPASTFADDEITISALADRLQAIYYDFQVYGEDHPCRLFPRSLLAEFYSVLS